MKKNKRILLVVLIAVVLLLAIFIYPLINPSVSWYCSAKGLRVKEKEFWEKAFTSKQSSIYIDEHLIEKYKVSSDANFYHIEVPPYKKPDEPFAFELYEADAKQSLEIGNGTLEYLGLGSIVPDANNMLGNELRYNFFDVSGQPASEKDIYSNLGMFSSPTEYVSHFLIKPFPSVKFGFHFSDIEDLKIYNIMVFDTNTHKLLSTDYSSMTAGSYGWINTTLSLWHRTPVDVVLDISCGPSEIYEFPPMAGEGFEREKFSCRLLGVFENVDNNSQPWELRRILSNNSYTIMYFVCQPGAMNSPLTFDYIDKSGKVIGSYARTGEDCSYLSILRESLENITTIRATYRPHRCHVVFHLPFIPGLPEQNEDIDNLFDIHIPYAKFRNANQLGKFISDTLQFSFFYIYGNPPKKSISSIQFPLELSDVTIRDLAKIYTKGGTLKIDKKNDRLELEYPESFLTRIKRIYQKILQK